VDLRTRRLTTHVQETTRHAFTIPFALPFRFQSRWTSPYGHRDSKSDSLTLQEIGLLTKELRKANPCSGSDALQCDSYFQRFARSTDSVYIGKPVAPRGVPRSSIRKADVNSIKRKIKHARNQVVLRNHAM